MSLRDVRSDLQRDLKPVRIGHMRSHELKDRATALRVSLALSFFSNTCKRLPDPVHLSYLSLDSGVKMRMDEKEKLASKDHDWIVFTEATGLGSV